MLKHVLIAALSAFVGFGTMTPSDAYAAKSKSTTTSAKASKVRWTAGQCRARCDFLYFSGKDRSKCYTNVCTKYPE